MLTKLKDEQGSTLVELIMVMVLMVFFGITIFTLIQAGAQTEQKIINNKNAQVDARIAMSYINVRVRKNDSSGKIEVAEVGHTGESGIILKFRSFDADYDRWIYFSDGYLRECIVDPGVQPSDDLSTEIVALDDYSVEYNSEENSLINGFEYEYNGQIQKITYKIHLRNSKMDENIVIFEF